MYPARPCFVPVHSGTLDPTQHGCMREGTLKDDNEHGQCDGHQQAHFNAQEQRADEGHQEDQEIPQVGLQQKKPKGERYCMHWHMAKGIGPGGGASTCNITGMHISPSMRSPKMAKGNRSNPPELFLCFALHQIQVSVGDILAKPPTNQENWEGHLTAAQAIQCSRLQGPDPCIDMCSIVKRHSGETTLVTCCRRAKARDRPLHHWLQAAATARLCMPQSFKSPLTLNR